MAHDDGITYCTRDAMTELMTCDSVRNLSWGLRRRQRGSLPCQVTCWSFDWGIKRGLDAQATVPMHTEDIGRKYSSPYHIWAMP
eukprot:scaffold120329_cov45-Prasinocladus_malaysianus.AAC.1